MLGNFVKKNVACSDRKTSTRLTDYILENWKEENKGKLVSLEDSGNTYDDFWFSPSSISKLCPRAYALACASKRRIGESFGAQTLFTFGIGNAYHHMFQDNMLRSLGDVFQGTWERHVRDEIGTEVKRVYSTDFLFRRENVERGWVPMPGYEGYPAPKWVYLEPKFRDHEYRYVGKCDAIFAWPDKEEGGEIKTERLSARSVIEQGPREAHVKQCQSYMWQFGLNSWRLIYVFKGEEILKNAILEYVIERDEGIIEEIKAGLKDSIAAIKVVQGLDIPENILNGIRDDVSLVYDVEPFESENAVEKVMISSIPCRLEECTKRTDVRAKGCQCKDLCLPKRAPGKKLLRSG
jgi:hypothetical protein